MPTPPWYGHLLRGITEVSCKLKNRRGNGPLFICGVTLLLLHVPCQTAKRKSNVVSALYRPVDIWYAKQQAQSTRCWEKSTCPLARLIAHSSQSGSEKRLKIVPYCLIFGHCGG